MPANPLLNAPARLSDLRGEELAVALRERHERHKHAWIAGRGQRIRQRRQPSDPSLLRRLMMWVFS